MVCFSSFDLSDLFELNNVNLDPTTENYNIGFYMHYLHNWPDLFKVAKSLNGRIAGYVMAKDEGSDKDYHGHISALSVAPEYRRCGISSQLMDQVEEIFEKKGCYYVDLFVRTTNEVAIKLYQKLGYSIYRRIIDYYHPDAAFGDERDAYDMRKCLSRDIDRNSLKNDRREVHVDELNVDD